MAWCVYPMGDQRVRDTGNERVALVAGRSALVTFQFLVAAVAIVIASFIDDVECLLTQVDQDAGQITGRIRGARPQLANATVDRPVPQPRLDGVFEALNL